VKQHTKQVSVARAVASALILIGPALGWTCNRPPVGPRPECPGEDSLRIAVPLSGPITGIPEFHDCQRFILVRGTDTVYDSLYAIFAAFHLESLPNHLDTSSSQAPIAVPAATVYSYGGVYASLGIRPGFNCLYLWDSKSWKAKMVPNPTGNCTPPVNPLAVEGTELEVRVVSNPQYGPPDYPPVARWDWDARRSKQYIGIMCGAAWCEIGDRGFVPSQVFAKLLPVDPTLVNQPSGLEINRVSKIKGWYDAQLLAVRGSNGRLRPSGVWATFVPHPALDRMDDVANFDNFWVHVGTVVLSGDLPTYKSKLNFAFDPTQPQSAKIYFCHGNRVLPGQSGGCEMNAASLPTCSPQPDPWWAKIVSRAGTVYKCITRRTHPGAGAHIPGTVRWRWVLDDEGTWGRCTGGCCTIPH